MADINAINNAFNEPENISVSVITVSGIKTEEVKAGTSVSEFKSKFSLNGTKLVNENGVVLSNSDIITDGMEIYVSTPKQNG